MPEDLYRIGVQIISISTFPKRRLSQTGFCRQAFAYKAFYLRYPNTTGRAYARRHGRDPGGAIEIHGNP